MLRSAYLHANYNSSGLTGLVSPRAEARRNKVPLQTPPAPRSERREGQHERHAPTGPSRTQETKEPKWLEDTIWVYPSTPREIRPDMLADVIHCHDTLIRCLCGMANQARTNCPPQDKAWAPQRLGWIITTLPRTQRSPD